MEDIYFKFYLYFWLTLFGACIGSFLNVVVYRLPRGNFFSEARSFCPACKQKLIWRDLIPVISYLSLKGRCRYCGVHIPTRYPVVEISGAALAVLCFARFGLGLRLVVSFGVLAVLLAVALIDFETMEIPDSLVLALTPFAVLAVWAWNDVPLSERAIGFFAVSLPMLILTVIIHEAFGGGDIKLMAVCGFLLGWKNTLLAFFVALILGGGYAAYILIGGKSKRGAHIAFGPYLCVGVATAIFGGSQIIGWYLNFFM